MLFPLIFNDNRLISKCWRECNWAIFGCLHTLFINKIPIYSPIVKYGKTRMSLNQRINTRKTTFQCVLWHLSPGDTPKIVICAHLTRAGWYTLYILIFAFYLIQRTPLLTMQWRHNIFWWQSFGDNKVIKNTHPCDSNFNMQVGTCMLKFELRVTHFPGSLLLTSNKQARLRVTLRNLFARFSAKRNIDRKN